MSTTATLQDVRNVISELAQEIPSVRRDYPYRGYVRLTLDESSVCGYVCFDARLAYNSDEIVESVSAIGIGGTGAAKSYSPDNFEKRMRQLVG